VERVTLSRALSEVGRRGWVLTLGVAGIGVWGNVRGCGALEALAAPVTVPGPGCGGIVFLVLVLFAAAAHPLHPRRWTAVWTLGACGAWWFGGVLAMAGC
jgi:hypothetical protein